MTPSTTAQYLRTDPPKSFFDNKQLLLLTICVCHQKATVQNTPDIILATMKIFSILKKNKSTTKNKGKGIPDAVSTAGSVDTYLSGGSGKGKSSRTHSKKQRPPLEEITPDEKTINVKAAEAFMELMNACQPEDPTYLEKLADCYESEETKVVLEDGEAYKPEACNGLIVATFQSFPDFKFRWGEIAPIDNNPNKIAIEDVSAQGTFTGKPYTILPGVLPELQPTGKLNSNDEQRFELTMNNGKIARFEVYALGIHTGFAGFYTKAGGSLVPPGEGDAVKVEEATE